MEVVRLKAGDRDELVAFLDRVFTLQNGHPMDFANLFPRIFKDTDENMGWYYAVKEDGRIVGTAASHPLTYNVTGTLLKVSAGGNVAVDPACRNRGMMQALLHKINEDLVAEDFDLAYLHGDRKRYRTFGFERCGIEYLVYFTPSMLQKEGCVADVELEELTDFGMAHAIDCMQWSGFCREEADMESVLKASGRKALGIYREGGLIGFVSLDVAGAYMAELRLQDEEDLGSALMAVANYLEGKTTVMRLPAYEFSLLRKAIPLCARYNIIQPANFKILKFDRVVSAFFQAKSLYAPLMDGKLVLDTELFGKWTVTCKNGVATVKPGGGRADVCLPGTRVYEFLFGPNHPLLAEMAGQMAPKKAILATNWFPLPLFVPHLA